MFLGLVLDSVRSHVFLFPVRQQSFLECLHKFQLEARVSWRTCLCLLGLMATMDLVVPLAVLHMRPVYCCLLRARPGPSEHPSGPGPSVTEPCLHPSLVVGRASFLVWGHSARGSPRGCRPHQYPRSAGCPSGSAAFPSLLEASHIIVHTDSTVAAAYMNRQGDLGSDVLCRLAANSGLTHVVFFSRWSTSPVPGTPQRTSPPLQTGKSIGLLCVEICCFRPGGTCSIHSCEGSS